MVKSKRLMGIALADFIGVAGVFAVLILVADPVWRFWSNTLPASHWFEVHKVEVRDTPANASPVLIVERTIKRPFWAQWIVEVEIKSDAGYSTVCTATGSNSYQPDAALPMPLDLDWWTWPTKCTPFLKSGETYRVETRWVIKPENYPAKTLFTISNDFRVLPVG